MLTRARIVVDGVVQGVGYRYTVRTVARTHNLVGYIKNLDDGTVEIVCEGERDAIGSFAEEIRLLKEPIRVDKVDVTFEEAKQEFKMFKIITDDLAEEMVEGFSTGNAYYNILVGKQDNMLSKQDQMLNKQDSMLNKQDQMLSKQDETVAEIHALREDMKAFLDERFRRLEKDIDQIKVKLGMT